jgi:hypothetical protein
VHITASHVSHTKHGVSQIPDMAQIALAAPLPAPDSHGITDYSLRLSHKRNWLAVVIIEKDSKVCFAIPADYAVCEDLMAAATSASRSGKYR